MSAPTPLGAGHDGPPPETPVPWINPTIQQRIRWRDGDIVVSVPAKSGTTWMMNIVHQLRSGGDTELVDIYAEVPWLEIVPRPDSKVEDLVRAFDQIDHDRRRVFKTHSAPGPLPYHAPEVGPEVQYVVVVRNPEEAVASLRPFLVSHSDAWFDLWQLPRETLVGPDFETFFTGAADLGLLHSIFGFVAAWWPLRHNPNVLLIHFADMKRHHEGSVRAVGDFLGLRPTAAQWPGILEYTSFDWMKAHEHKFELRSVSDVPILAPGAMMRKGRIGASAADGITPAMADAIADVGRQVLDDESAIEWCYNGGPVPG